MCREWDTIQTQYLLTLLKEYGIQSVFEAGTFEGDTSLYFSQLGFKVFTVEKNMERAYRCLHRFRETSIELHHGDSVDYLAVYLARHPTATFYYIDDHERGETPPIKQELSLLFTQPKFLAMVHDIQVPNQPHFTYGEDITKEFYTTSIPDDVMVLFPQYKTTPNPYLKTRTIGYCLVSKGHPFIYNKNFAMETQ